MPSRTSADVPADGPRIIAETLRGLKWNPITAGGAPTRIEAEPIRMYALRFDTVRRGLDPESLPAEPGPWLYLVSGWSDSTGEPTDGVVELLRPPFPVAAGVTPDTWAVGRISAGPVYEKLGRLVSAATPRGHPAVGSIEPRVLDVPALGVQAVWYHRTGPDDEFFSFPDRADAGFDRPLPAPEFVDRLQALARESPWEDHGPAVAGVRE